MRKFTSIAATVVMSLAMVSSVFANGSIAPVNPVQKPTTTEVKTESGETVADVTVKAATVADFADLSVEAQATVQTILDVMSGDATVADVIAAACGDVAELTVEGSDEVIALADLGRVTDLIAFVKEGKVLADGSIEATIKGGDLVLNAIGAVSEEEKAAKIAEIKEKWVIIQFELKEDGTSVAHAVKIDDVDPTTGEITAKFPCAGPFFIATK